MRDAHADLRQSILCSQLNKIKELPMNDLNQLESALLDMIDECPNLTMQIDHWLTCRTKVIFKENRAQRQVGQEHHPYGYACPVHCGCLWRDNRDGTMSLLGGKSNSCAVCEITPLDKLLPLFAAPQPAQVPLTDEQINKIFLRELADVVVNSPEGWRKIVRAIEQAHGITGATE